MATNFWDDSPIVVPAPAVQAQPGDGNFWINDPMAPPAQPSSSLAKAAALKTADPWASYVEPAAGGWRSAPIVAPAGPAAGGWASAPIVTPAPAPTPVYSGSVLPFSRYSDGSVGFDSNAGIVGSIKNALTLPGDVATGAVDPMSPGGINRSNALAAALSPLTPEIGAGGMAIPGVGSTFKAAKVTPPTADALHAAASDGYDAARDMGVEYSSPAVAAMAQRVQSGLNGDGILGVLAPKTHAILDQLQAVPAVASSVPLGNLDAARKAFGHAAGDFTNPTEQRAASVAKDAIDNFVTRPDPMAVVSGPAAEAAAAITEARANAAAGFRSDRLNGVAEQADLRASAANSGANLGNSIRSRVASVLNSPKQAAGYSPAEIDALTGVVKGTPLSNTARILGHVLGGGGGLGSAIEGFGGGRGWL
jgi:hypothetical protein